MTRFTLADGMTGYSTLNTYRLQVLFNGVYRDALSFEIDGNGVDISTLYGFWNNKDLTSHITCSSDVASEGYDGFVIPVKLSVEYKEIEKETLTTAAVNRKVITMVLAAKTASEIKAEPANNALAEATEEILMLRKQVNELTEIIGVQ